MVDIKKPEIIVFAGPNGSGKSTIKNYLQFRCLYINADDIKKANNCSDLDAAKIATKYREDAIEKRENFAFETVLSTDRNLKLLKEAKEKGYFIRCYFVLTKDVSININRVLIRVNKGGHDVPANKIISRYKKSINNIRELMKVCDVCNLYDNSNSSIVRIFKKRKDEYYYEESKRWTKNDIMNLTGVESLIERELN